MSRLNDLAPPRPHHPTVYYEGKSAVGEKLLEDLLTSSLILAEDWDRTPSYLQEGIVRCNDKVKALSLMVDAGLLTEYQKARVQAGTTFGLILGNYRVLDRIGAGGMAVVFKAEHLEMRHLVAAKVLPQYPGQDERLQSRFSAEMRIVARLRHPNIVAAMDAGRVSVASPDAPVLWYLIMEYVPGQDLEEIVTSGGPLPLSQVCSFAHQIASALAETHKLNLVHRDIKPSNIIITAEGQAKLLDFGLSRSGDHRLTTPGAVLGTIDFMAPEQAKDASGVDHRADTYSLGATLYWCLTGQLPFPNNGSPTESLLRRLGSDPPSLRDHVPNAPPEFDAVIRKMMAVQPEARFQTPQELLKALLPFLSRGSRGEDLTPSRKAYADLFPSSQHAGGDITLADARRVLIVDDEAGIRDFCKAILQGDGLVCDEAHDGVTALEKARRPYDVVLLDVNLPRLSGIEVLRRLRESPAAAHMKVIMFSGHSTPDEMSQMLLAGADEYLTKPFSVVQLQGRVQAALRLKGAQDRIAALNHHLMTLNAELERNLSSRNGDLIDTRNALVLALGKVVGKRHAESAGNLRRVQEYCKCLAEEAARSSVLAPQITPAFVDTLVACAPLYDIGKVSLPDHILMKPGKLNLEERMQMEGHTIAGSDTIREAVKELGLTPGFLQVAIDLARHHHERHDGTGYPDRLAGDAIPLAARILAVCHVYDALRSRRSYRSALSHASAVQIVTEGSPGQFDPVLLQVFQRCAPEFESITTELTEDN